MSEDLRCLLALGLELEGTSSGSGSAHEASVYTDQRKIGGSDPSFGIDRLAGERMVRHSMVRVRRCRALQGTNQHPEQLVHLVVADGVGLQSQHRGR